MIYATNHTVRNIGKQNKLPDMVKNRKNDNDYSYDQQIEHLFVSETHNENQELDDERKPEIWDETEIENYSHILYPIEFAIASYYLEEPGTTDNTILKELTSLVQTYGNEQGDDKSNIVKKVKTVNPDLRSTITKENGLIAVLKQAVIEGLQKEPITRKEFLLCLRYVMYCVDNRSWIPGGKGYLDWIANWLGLLGGEKKQEFDSFYDELSKAIGIDENFLKDEHGTSKDTEKI